MAGSEYDELDPLLVAAIEDHFARTPEISDVFEALDEVEALFSVLDPTSFLDDILDSPDPQASVKAYEQLVTGEWDGDLL
ncbi:hypothetical protein ACFY8X_39120 [Streptomyces tanashiensis]|uniref:hypothetical protein n=1 Tax=Streptomyces tanashiensis TaxID=67367 RepID=UPI0036F17AD7